MDEIARAVVRASRRPTNVPGGRRRVARLSVALLAAALAGCGSAAVDPDQLTVFAAASLRDVVTELGERFAATTGVPPVFNFAGSNVLALQIEAAPAADVFLSANEEWLNRIDEAGLLVPGSRRSFLSNRLVVVAHRDSPLTLDSASDLAAAPFRHLALGDPEAVPAGQYARAYLQRTRLDGGTLWARLAERVVPTADVRAALALVEAEPEVVGIVYRSDAQSSPGIRVLHEVEPGESPPIRYAAAAVRGRPGSELAVRFLELLTSEDGLRTFERYGFDRL